MPKILKILNNGLIAGLIAGALSFIFPIIPCLRSAVVETFEYKWGLCKLPNPFKYPFVGMSQKFFGFYTEPLAGFILQFLIFAIVFSILLLFLSKRKSARIVDLTKNK